MKKLLLLLLFIPLISFGQTYRNPNPKPIKIEVSQAPKTSADHLRDMQNKISESFAGAAANAAENARAARIANAQKEKNRLEAMKYADIRQKNQAIEIALNPKKAFNYGTDNNYIIQDKKTSQMFGFSVGTQIYHKMPNAALFARTKDWNYINEDDDGVITEIEISAPLYPIGTASFFKKTKKERKQVYRKLQPYIGNTEKLVKKQVENIIVGEKDKDGRLTHKIDINRAKVWGNNGFYWTKYYEDDYEYVIKENFAFISSKGVQFNAGVRYRGDKDEVTFEMLEGRRSYLKKLCKQIIATARLELGKKGLN